MARRDRLSTREDQQRTLQLARDKTGRKKDDVGEDASKNRRNAPLARRDRWSKREYQQHIFQLARGKPGRKDDVGEVASKNWWNSNQDSMSHMYEQEEIDVNGAKDANGEAYQQFWGGDKADRERYRADKQAELKKQFRANLAKHPAFKDKTRKELGNIADAYLSGNDFAGPGSEETAEALKEVAEYTTGDGEVAMSDERTWRKAYPRKASAKEEEPSADGPAETGSSTTIRNGKQKSKDATPATGATPIPPRTKVPAQTDVTTEGRYNKLSGADTGVRVNGAPVEVGDTATRSHIKDAQREAAQADALQKRRIRQGIQNDMLSDARRLAQEHLANQDALDANMKARQDRLRAEREAAHKKRMDERYKSRTLTGKTDWENLGRDSTKRDFSARAEGESDESWNARSGAVKAVEKLRERFAELGVKDADTNEFYAYNPNRMRDVSGLGNLFNKAVESGDLTDAQIDGINNTLDMYENEKRKNKATSQRFTAMRDAENVSKYRAMYGLTDRNAKGDYIISDDEIKEFHKQKQKAARDEILKGMQVAPGQGDAGGRGERIKQFSDGWMKLIDNGFNVEETLDKALSDPLTRKAYMAAKASVDVKNDPEAADKLDQIRRRVVMNQAMQEAGLDDKVRRVRIDGTGKTEDQIGKEIVSAMSDDMTRGLPGTYGLLAAEDNALDAESKARIAGVSQDDIYAAKKRGEEAATAPATDALKPRKKEDTQQAVKGGMVLQPRRRAS